MQKAESCRIIFISAIIISFFLNVPFLWAQQDATIVNFNKKGQQVTKYNAVGEAIDAHDGEIAYFDGVYYLYGTSYGCGFEWGAEKAPFCGFKTYSSTDMVHWADRGFMFDAKTALWQSRCNGNTYGCFRPHVIFNERTEKYVLWINVYDNRVGFRVFTSTSPIGPFEEVIEPTLAVNNNAPVAGLNNGDHDTFVDDDGKAYIAYTDWRTDGTIVIEELDENYLSETGKHVKAVTEGKTEAPALFKRNGIYYVTYSDPNCGYCSGTGTSYRTAKSPLGPWSAGIKISDNSCGGQPSFVSTIKLASGTVYLYGSDLWNNAAKNEALANFYWAPLAFEEDGAIRPMECLSEFRVSIDKDLSEKRKEDDKKVISSGTDGFSSHCDINSGIQRLQSFTPKKNGELSAVSITTFKSGYPEADLQIAIYELDANFSLSGKPLASVSVSADSINWSPNYFTINPNIPVKSGQPYAIVLRSTTEKGCYGVALNDFSPYDSGGAAYSSTNGASFSKEKNRSLMFRVIVSE